MALRKPLSPNTRGYIFDIDGTIMDSHDGHYHAWDRTTRAHSKTYTKEQIVKHFGKTTAQIAIELLHLTDPEIIERVSREKAGYFLEEIPSLKLFDGVIDVFTKVKEGKARLCLASSNERNVIEKIIHDFNLGQLVDASVSLDDITKGKPDPEMILKSAQKLHLDPRECVMVGDTIYDIQAGQRAGCRATVAVLTGVFTRTELEPQQPSLILSHVKDLLSYL
ncbi:MAG: pyrophosphatase PpaX [Promethearchaeota archaeon CR_4]|nr:MAG: pyrophosphatase PpaX [Candidatus Lokiarchaeota archaeon CR_4]